MAKMAAKRSVMKRDRVKPRGDARYMKRTAKGRFKESDDVGRSAKADRPTTAKKAVRAGYGDQGDRRKR